jgi:ribosome biogenesis SPOUT family RNA methylase Rps3
MQVVTSMAADQTISRIKTINLIIKGIVKDDLAVEDKIGIKVGEEKKNVLIKKDIDKKESKVVVK